MKVPSPKHSQKTRSRRQEPARRFTQAEERRIRAHIRARGMTFSVFLPESLANWLRKKVRAGVFHDPAEAAFVAFQDLIELDRHPQVRRQLLHAMLKARIDDPRPGIPADKVFKSLRDTERRYARTKPPKPQPLPKYRPRRLSKARPGSSRAAIFARRGGQATSPAKRSSARVNGRKGGRPRKSANARRKEKQQ